MNRFDSLTVKIRRFHALLANTGLMPHKADMLSGFGVESSKELTVEQLDALIERLEQIQEKKETASSPLRKKRSSVLDLLEQLGIKPEQNGRKKDWTRVNKYLMNPRIAGKLMYEMNEEELEALARKLRAIVKKQDEKVQQEKYWAANN